MSIIKYAPPGSVQAYIRSEKFGALIVGPVGPVSGDTEFLTTSGWKRVDQYQKGDLVAQWSEDGAMEFVEPLDYIVGAADTLIEFKSGKLRMCLSDNHRVPYYDYRGVFKVTTAADAAARPSNRTIPSTFTPSTLGMDMSDAEIRLAVAINADGHFPAQSKQCVIAVRKERKKARLRRLLTDCGMPWTETTYPQRETETRFVFYPEYRGKTFGAEWWLADKDQLQVIREEICHWDGLANHEEMRYYSRHKGDADFVQYVAHATGTSGFISKQEYPDHPEWNDTYTVFIGVKPGYKSLRKLRSDITKTERVPAVGGKQYCFSTPSTFFVARYKDSVFVTGNSGKTTASIFKILYHAARMRPQEDGIRRSRCVVIRNTRGQLVDTTIPSFQTWFGADIAPFLKTDMKMFLKVGDIECELLFRGMDDANDVRKLLSLEVSFAFLDEYREIPQVIYEAVQGRVGRYPSKAKGGCVTEDGSPNHHVFGSSNPPDYDSYFETLLSNPPANVDVFFQPSGLSPEADWTENLIDGYYENLAQGKGEDWIDVYIHSKFGKSLSGQPVFRAFDRGLHVTKQSAPLKHNPNATLLIGYDCGLTPAAVIAQVDATGRLVIYESVISESMGSLRFIREKLKPLLAARFPGCRSVIIADPAGQQRAQTDERTVFDVLRAEGFAVKAARTNSITARLTAVDAYLTRMVDSKPAFLVDQRAAALITALSGKYRYKVKTTGEVEDKPEKNHPHSDCADALQYVCLHADGGQTFGLKQSVAQPVQQVRYMYS